MNVLAIGDIVGARGCAFVAKHLPHLKRLKGIDYCVANAENAFNGLGISPELADGLLSAGVDMITTGNHVFRNKGVYEYLDSCRYILRPANYYDNNPGRGVAVADFGPWRAGIINLSGQAFLEHAGNPLWCVDRLLEEVAGCRVILLDFHAEATAEKRAMGYYLDGRVSAVFGTHTHVQTADEQILPAGTGYITDLGMTGCIDSVLGVTPESSVAWLKSGLPAKFAVAEGPQMLCGCVFEIDSATGRCTGVERICVT